MDFIPGLSVLSSCLARALLQIPSAQPPSTLGNSNNTSKPFNCIVSSFDLSGHNFSQRHLLDINEVLIEILPSDIVGFTAMAAQSSPMQVVTLSFFIHLKKNSTMHR